MTDDAEPAAEPEPPADGEWFTVRRAEVALALAIAVIAAAYVVTPSGSAARFVVTFAAGAVSLAALRFLIMHRRDRR
jgi:hypothetical protein